MIKILFFLLVSACASGISVLVESITGLGSAVLARVRGAKPSREAPESDETRRLYASYEDDDEDLFI
jgi:hypothetical protein